jgi:hypothetical protein
MFPGLTTRLSESIVVNATSIAPMTDMIRLTSTTAIATIVPPPNIATNGGILFVVPTGGNTATTTAGNITVVVTMADLRVTVLVYSVETGKWYPGAIS